VIADVHGTVDADVVARLAFIEKLLNETFVVPCEHGPLAARVTGTEDDVDGLFMAERARRFALFSAEIAAVVAREFGKE